MRIALLSDIHGNLIALDAVLDDIQQQGGVDEFGVLGDIAAIGPQPIAVLERLQELPSVRYVRGNTDRYLTTGERPSPSHSDVLNNLSLLPVLVEVAKSFCWTQGAITSKGWLPFLDALPLEQRTTLPNGARLLAVHAAPGRDDGDGVDPDSPPEVLAHLFANCQADLVFVGHTHWPANLRIGAVQVVNLGSVSNPRIPSLHASYVMLEGNSQGYKVKHRFVPYDREAVIHELHAVRHPTIDYIMGYMRGNHIVKRWGEPVVSGDDKMTG